MPAEHVHSLSPYLIRFGDSAWGLRWYGVSYLAAFLVGFLLYRGLARRGLSDLRPEQVGDFIFGGAIFGVVLGGRLGYMLFYNLDGFLHDPLMFFRLYEGGMSAHGGILGLAFYSLWFARRHHVSWLNLGDNLVTVAPLGLLFGRLANFINGELYGRTTGVAWSMKFPKELLTSPPGTQVAALRQASDADPSILSLDDLLNRVPDSDALRQAIAPFLTPRHPSQLYEAFLEGALLFSLLWWMRTRLRLHDGVLTGVFFIGYAAFRSFCEIFREPDAPLTGMLTRGQFLSIFLVMIGLAFLLASRSTRVRPDPGRDLSAESI